MKTVHVAIYIMYIFHKKKDCWWLLHWRWRWQKRWIQQRQQRQWCKWSTRSNASFNPGLILCMTIIRVVKSSQLQVKIPTYLVSIGRLLCLAFLYGWHFLNKILLDWPLTLTTQPSTLKLSDNPAIIRYTVYCMILGGTIGTVK